MTESTTTNSLPRTNFDYTSCPTCGRQYPRNTSATRQQYFCSSCGSDLKQEEILPLLPNNKIKSDKNTKCIGLIITTLLLIITLIIIYFTIINPAASNDSNNHPLFTNTTAPTISPTISTL
eukprot:735846_1